MLFAYFNHSFSQLLYMFNLCVAFLSYSLHRFAFSFSCDFSLGVDILFCDKKISLGKLFGYNIFVNLSAIEIL